VDWDLHLSFSYVDGWTHAPAPSGEIARTTPQGLSLVSVKGGLNVALFSALEIMGGLEVSLGLPAR
jgi:hypothetical protein